MESVNTSTMDEAIAADTPEHAPEDPMSASELKTGLPWKRLTCMTIGLALLIIMAEISRLSGSMLDKTGQAWSFNELAGLGPSVRTWDGWLTSAKPFETEGSC